MSKCTGRLDRLSTRAPWALLLWAGAAILACATVSIPIELQRHHRTASIQGTGEPIGADECATCHDEVQGRAQMPAHHQDCEACHGAGTLHVDSEAAADIRFPTSHDCLACHESGHTANLAWGTGQHERAGVLCSDCHNPHNQEPRYLRTAQQASFLQADRTTQVCVSCHTEVASQLHLPSHHPVREGMIGCSDCHDPHGDRRTALGGEAALCASCHQDHAGPWIFEHAPVAEGCSTCHSPHGTASYNLLETSQPALCLSCHSTADYWHVDTGEGLNPGDPVTGAVASAFYTRCTDCHGAIHGSYEDPHLVR
ncbi:MAG TPA: cytochrome c3 family protein [Myxococcota bacterium]